MSSLVTIRIEAFFECSLCATDISNCEILHHIQAEVGDSAVAVVPLWNGQFDLAVEERNVEKVNVQFKNFTRYRLEGSDPLFLPEPGYSQEQTALRVLNNIRNRYRQCIYISVPDEPGKRARVKDWFAIETKLIDTKIEDIEGRVRICRK